MVLLSTGPGSRVRRVPAGDHRVHHSERGVADQAPDRHHPAGDREALRLTMSVTLFVFGIDENSPREAIDEFTRVGEVTELYSPRGREV